MPTIQRKVTFWQWLATVGGQYVPGAYTRYSSSSKIRHWYKWPSNKYCLLPIGQLIIFSLSYVTLLPKKPKHM